MTLRQVIYTSLVCENFKRDDIASIIDVAINNNSKHQITGLLVYHKDQFLQVIEGPHHNIQCLLENILRDERHQHVTVFLDRNIEKREFPLWLMGFKTLHEAGNASFPFVELQDFTTANPGKALAFLKGFLQW